jgi:hypothetical protein
MQMAVTSLRLSTETLAQLKMLACKVSMRDGKQVSWASLVRNAIEQELLKNRSPAIDASFSLLLVPPSSVDSNTLR